MSEWQPMNTAPKDGRAVLLFCEWSHDEPDIVTGKWRQIVPDFGDWQLIQAGGYAEDSDVGGDPVAWMPLMDAPAWHVPPTPRNPWVSE